MAADIRKLFPKHTRYCEPFFGSGAVMLAGDGEGVAEFVNDLDKGLANFWRVLADDHMGWPVFQRLVDCHPFSNVHFRESKSRMDVLEKEMAEKEWQEWSKAPAIRAAVDFFVVNRQSRQALGKDFATPTIRLRRNMNEQVSAWLTAVEGLPHFHARLKRVEIRCQPAVEFIKKLDSEETLFYCDPPYVHETRSSTGEYKHEMTVDDHKELLSTLGEIEGKFVLSGYDCKLYEQYAAGHGWRRVDFDLPNNASSAGTKERKIECCWLNY